jgi:hypothetical protein
MKLDELSADTVTYLVLYRIKEEAGVGTADERRGLLTEMLADMNGDRAGRFFEEAGHVSTSAWTVKVPSSLSASELVQKLKQKAKLSAGVDYLWAIQVADPINQSHITRDPMPQPKAGSPSGKFTKIALKP